MEEGQVHEAKGTGGGGCMGRKREGDGEKGTTIGVRARGGGRGKGIEKLCLKEPDT